MELSSNNNTMIHEKYEALLNGVVPEDYKDHILYDKISLLQKQNSNLENTIMNLKDELSNIKATKNFHLNNSEEQESKYCSISAAIKQSLDISEVSISQYSEVHSKALEAVKKSSDGFSLLMNTMKSKLFPPNKKLLDFMNTILDQVHEIRGQLSAIHNYLTVLEYNDKSLRESLNTYDRSPSSNRSHSALRLDPFEQPIRALSKRFTRTLLNDSHSTKNSLEFKSEDAQTRINTMKIALGKIKNQRDQTDIENQKLLLQLKQAKEQLALCEENAAAKEVSYENQIKRLSNIIGKIKEIPNMADIVIRCEREINRTNKNYRRTRSTLHNNN